MVSVICGWVLLGIDRDPRGIDLVRNGLAGNPNNLTALNLGGAANVVVADHDTAFNCFARAYRLSPGVPDAFASLTGMGWVELERGNDDAALSWFDRSLATGREWVFTYTGIVAALTLSGRREEAQNAARTLRALAPDWRMQSGSAGMRNAWKRMRSGLRLAGLLPE